MFVYDDNNDFEVENDAIQCRSDMKFNIFKATVVNKMCVMCLNEDALNDIFIIPSAGSGDDNGSDDSY